MLACNCTNQKVYVTKPDTSSILKGIKRYDSILEGQWSICQEGIINGQTILYNICPEIIFHSNSTALIFTVGVADETINWQLVKDTLFINHLAFAKNDTSQLFQNYKYLIIKIKREDSASINLELIQPEKNYFYYLWRSKQPIQPKVNFDVK